MTKKHQQKLKRIAQNMNATFWFILILVWFWWKPFCILNLAWICSWNQLVLSNVGKISCNNRKHNGAETHTWHEIYISITKLIWQPIDCQASSHNIKVISFIFYFFPLKNRPLNSKRLTICLFYELPVQYKTIRFFPGNL